MKRILFIQHAGGLGGSNMSLLFTLQAMDLQRFEPVVGLAFPSMLLRQFYEEKGFRVVEAKGVGVFRHTTAGWGKVSSVSSLIEFFKNIWNWRKGQAEALRLIAKEKPDIVHLNSVILAPVASVLLSRRVPFVWHVRESPVQGYFGLRRSIIRRFLERAGDRVVFISSADRKAWVDDKCGTVVYNFVNLDRFRPRFKPANGANSPVQLPTRKTILYVGGFMRIKGIIPLLEALKILKDRDLEFYCLMPGTIFNSTNGIVRRRFIRIVKKQIGYRNLGEKCTNLIHNLGLSAHIKLMPFHSDMPSLLERSDCLVFPSIAPHFARPVIEAQAMGVPVVGSQIEGVTELIEGTGAGLLAPVGDPQGLADCFLKLFSNSDLLTSMRAKGPELAKKRYDGTQQIQIIEQLYDKTLNP